MRPLPSLPGPSHELHIHFIFGVLNFLSELDYVRFASFCKLPASASRFVRVSESEKKFYLLRLFRLITAFN
jgi:hypothetical protein